MREQKVRLNPNTQFCAEYKGMARLSIQKSKVSAKMFPEGNDYGGDPDTDVNPRTGGYMAGRHDH